MSGTPRGFCRYALTLAAALCPLFAPAVSVARAVPAAPRPPAPLLALHRALTRATSFQVIYTARSADRPPAVARTTIVAMREKGLRRFHIIAAMRPSGAGETTIVEDIVAGSRLCERIGFNAPLPLKGRFTCTNAPATAAALISAADPSQSLTAGGARVRLTPARSRTVKGQKCAGYGFVVTRNHTVRARGTLYVARTTGLPCEEDAVTIGPPIGPSNDQGTATITSVSIWSRFDDPALAVPAP